MASEQAETNQPAKPPVVWSNELGDALPGARVAVRVRGVRASGRVDIMEVWGVVKTAQADTGIELELEGDRKGQSYWIPPDHRTFRRAPPGPYKLHGTDDVVEGLDFVCRFMVRVGRTGEQRQGAEAQR
jgi:hypothetical protein